MAWQPLGGEWIALGWVARTDLVGIDVAATPGVAHRALAPVQRFASQGFVCGHSCGHAIALYILRRAERVLVGEISEGGIVPRVSHTTKDGYAVLLPPRWMDTHCGDSAGIEIGHYSIPWFQLEPGVELQVRNDELVGCRQVSNRWLSWPPREK